MKRDALLLPLAIGWSSEYVAELNDSLGVSVQPGSTKGRLMLPSECTRRPVRRGLLAALLGLTKRLNSASRPTSKPRPSRWA